MPRLMQGPLRGLISLFLFTVNTVFWTVPLLILHLLKLLIPASGWRRALSRLQNRIGTAWISFNNANLALTNPVKWEIAGVDGLSKTDWYLVVANHRSWVDILVLQRAFNRKVPFLKFFLKKQLFWVPFLGLAWWALDYPFLERSARGSKDLDSIRRAAAKFKILPTSVMNFAEGTRFTAEKHEKTRSPYAHLLKPKPAGMTFLLNEMSSEIATILDVTIAYPGGAPTLWDFLCGRAEVIRVEVEAIPVTPDLVGDFGNDKAFRRSFTTWQKEWWARKDESLARLLN